MIGFYLAARHPDRFGHIAIMLAGHQVSEQGKTLELDFARLMSEGRTSEAGALLVGLMAPDLQMPGVAPALGGLLVRVMFGQVHRYFASDVMVEAEAVMAFDAREVLPEIPVPVLLIGCDRDVEFPREVYEETARLIADCTLRIYENKTAIQAGSDNGSPRPFKRSCANGLRLSPSAARRSRRSSASLQPPPTRWPPNTVAHGSSRG